MHDFTPIALAEHLNAALMVAPANTLDGLKSSKSHERNKAVEWLADHLSLQFRHHNIALVDASSSASAEDPDFLATQLQARSLKLAEWQPERAG